MLETERGQRVRADFRCTSVDRRRALRLGAAARGHAVRAHPASGAAARSGSSADGGATEVTLTSERDAARALAARLADDARRRRAGASTRRSTGIERALVGIEAPPATDAEVVGVGRPASGARRSPERALAMLRDRARRRPSRRRAVELDAGRAARARGRCPTRSPTRVGRRRACSTGHEHRIRRAAGTGYPDLVRLRAGRARARPRRGRPARPTPSRSRRVLEACARRGRRRGPLRRRHQRRRRGRARSRASTSGVIALDLRRHARGRGRPRLADRHASGPGLRGPEAEAALGAHGLTLGHFPQSFEYATIGGFAATRSAGQASSGYGRFDELVTALAMTTPDRASCARWRRPHTAAGPALRELVARLRGRARRDHRGHRAGAPGAADAPLRGLDRAPTSPPAASSSARSPRRTRCPTSPGSPTRPRPGSRSASRAPRARSAALLDAYLRLRRRRGGCLVICGWEGERGVGRAPPGARRRALLRARRRGRRWAQAPGEAWERGRYEGPYLRDELHRPRLLRRDARDLAHLVAPRRALRAPSAARSTRVAARPGHAGDRHVPPLARLPRRRLALLHLRRPRARRARRSSSGGRRRPPPARRSSPPAARSPTTTRSAATTPPTWRPRWASSGSRRCGRSRSASTRPGS